MGEDDEKLLAIRRRAILDVIEVLDKCNDPCPQCTDAVEALLQGTPLAHPQRTTDMTKDTDALADLKDALEGVDIEEGCTIFNHTPEEIGLMVMENRESMLSVLNKPIGLREEFVVAGPWASADDADENGEPLWKAEVQDLGGWSVIATVWGGSERQTANRAAAIAAALATPASDVAPVALDTLTMAKALHDQLWSDDESTRQRSASPYTVESSRAAALREAEILLAKLPPLYANPPAHPVDPPVVDHPRNTKPVVVSETGFGVTQAPVDPVAGGEALREALEALLLARSWVQHAPGCSIHTTIATEDGFREECNCQLIDQYKVIDDALAALKGPAT